MANRELSLRVGVELGNTQQKLQALNNNIKLATAQFKNASAGIENFENSTQGLKAKLQQLNTSYQQSAKKVEVLTKAIEDGNKTLAKAEDKYEENKRAVAGIEKALEKARSSYSETSNEVKELEQALEKANKELKQSENASRSADNNLNKLERQLQDAQREAKEFSKAMNDTNESLNDLSTDSPFANMLGDIEGIAGQFDILKGKIGAVVGVIGTLSKAFVGLGVNAVRWLGDVISKVVTFSAKIGGAVAGIAGFSIKLAGDFKALDEMFNATFGDMAKTAEETMQRVANSTGIYVERLKAPFSQFYSQLKGSGVEASEALKLTEKGMGLVADASAYYNMSMEEASELLRSFIRGNTEAGDRIGLFTSEAQRNTEAMKKYNKKWNDLTEAQKQMLMLDISEEIYKQSGAIGQAIREADGLENVLGNLKYVAQEFIATLGENMLEPAINSMKDFSLALLDAKKELETNGLGSAIKVMVDHIVGELNKMADRIPEVMKNVIDSMVSFIENSLPSIMSLGSKIVQNIATGIVENKEAISTGISSLISQIASWINKNMPAIMEAGRAILDAIKTGIENNMPAIETAVYNITRTAVDLSLEYKGMILEAGLEVGGEFIKGVWEGIWNAGRNYKPQNDNFYLPTAEEAKTKGAEYGQAWITSSGEVIKGDMSLKDNIKSIFSGDTFTQVQVSGADSGFAFVDGVKVKISEQTPQIKKVINDLLKSEEKAKEEGKKTGKAQADGVKKGVTEGKEQVKGASKQVATESSKAMLDELQNLTPETYQKMLDVSQSIRQSATDMYNGAKYSFSQLGKASKEAMTDMYKGVATSMYKTSQKVRQEASNLYNGAKTSFVNLANVGKNQFSNLYKNATSYTDKMRREVMSDWSTMASYISSRKITGTVTIRRNTINSTQTEKARIAPNVALSGQYYNSRTKNSRAVNNVLSPAKTQNTKADIQVIKELQNNNALLAKMVEILMSERTTIVENSIQLDARQIARGTAKYIEEEITSMNTRKSRLAGSFSF